MGEVFPSKKDGWIVALLVVCLGAGLAGTIAAMVSGGRSAILFGALAWAVMLAIFGLLVFPMRYEVGGEHLVIRFGVVRVRIPYADILRVEPSRNPISSPALSLDRLRIAYRKGRRENLDPDLARAEGGLRGRARGAHGRPGARRRAAGPEVVTVGVRAGSGRRRSR